MSKQRVCILTVKSLSALPKVRFPGDSSCPIKCTFLSRNLTTAQSFGDGFPERRNPKATGGLNPSGGFGDRNQDRQRGNLVGFSGPDYTRGNYWGNRSSFNQNFGGTMMDGSDPLEELEKFCKEGKAKEAVEMLLKLQSMHVTLNYDCLLSLIRVCGESMAIKEAKLVHEHIMRAMPSPDVNTYNKLLEMYSKCGAMDDALDVFDEMPERDWVSWDTMITWLAKNELGEDAIHLFTQFKQAGLKPNAEMFIAVFSACGVLADVDQGMFHFTSMTDDFHIVPTMEHYLSIVQMLASAGYLDEALEFIDKMHLEQNVHVWETLMYLSRAQGNLELGDRCAEIVEELDPARLDEPSKAGFVPVIGASDMTIVKEKKNLVERRTQGYLAGERSFPDTDDKIYGLLRNLKAQMIEAGYVPETKFVLHDVDQESKEENLHAHSERLALAGGFLTSPARRPVRVTKNNRFCVDCHNACKIISMIVGRRLIMRDHERFHHMQDGVCSCNDYW